MPVTDASHRVRGAQPGCQQARDEAGDKPDDRWERDLPGMDELGLSFDTADRTLPAREVIADYYGRYEQHFGLKVVRPADVTRVRATLDGFEVTFDDEYGDQTFSTQVLVNATGTWGAPFVPWYPGMNEFAGRHLHTVDYTDAESLRDQAQHWRRRRSLGHTVAMFSGGVVGLGGGYSVLAHLLDRDFPGSYAMGPAVVLYVVGVTGFAWGAARGFGGRFLLWWVGGAASIAVAGVAGAAFPGGSINAQPSSGGTGTATPNRSRARARYDAQRNDSLALSLTRGQTAAFGVDTEPSRVTGRFRSSRAYWTPPDGRVTPFLAVTVAWSPKSAQRLLNRHPPAPAQRLPGVGDATWVADNSQLPSSRGTRNVAASATVIGWTLQVAWRPPDGEAEPLAVLSSFLNRTMATLATI